MVIGNGFFSENRQTALAEMTERSKCEVRHLPFPTVGNITYYISYTGDLYGQQMIQGLSLDDCKDAAQDAFIYLCCEGYMGHQRETDEFIGLWKRVARFRAIDRLKHKEDRQVRGEAYDVVLETHGRRDQGYEFDWFRLQPGEKRQRYLRMFFEGNRPTEIANACGVSLGTVSSSVTRSMQFYQRYFKHEIEVWNRIK